MKLIKYIVPCILLFAHTSCNDDFLDTAPYNGISSAQIFDSDANATMAINGVYNAMAQQAFFDLFPCLLTNVGPDAYSWGRSAFGLALVTGTATSRDAQTANLYRSLYRPIVYANDVIAGLENNTKVSEPLRNRLIGEAKFARGLCYFYLSNIWGDVVLIDKPTPVTETFLPRSSNRVVRDFVIADFRDAAELLPVSYPASELGRATKGAAIAMLGKAYLYDQQWAAAAEALGKLLKAPFTYELTENYFDSFYWQTQNNKESVFEIQYHAQEGLGSAFDKRFGHRVLNKQGEDYSEASATALSVFTNTDGTSIDLSTIPQQGDFANELTYGRALISWYDSTFANADPRLHQSIIMPGGTFVGINNTTYKVLWPYAANANASPPALRTTWTNVAVLPIRKFLTQGTDNLLRTVDCPTNLPLVRFADVLLMYAEAVNEANGPTAEAYEAVNRVRERAGVVHFAEGLTKDAMRREIWLERYKELMFETHLFFDAKRWNVAHTADPVFGMNRPELDFRLKPLFNRVFDENRDYLWPVPGGEIDLNPLLGQNPNW